MLVLSRKTGQSVHIDDRIKVTVVKMHGNRVKIGIEAPKEVSIVRGELDMTFDIPVMQPTPGPAEHLCALG